MKTKILLSLLTCLSFVAFSQIVVPQSDVLAQYCFSNNLDDGSHHGFNASNHLSASPFHADRHGVSSESVYFNGSSDYLLIPDTLPLRLNNTDFTISFWLYQDGRSQSAMQSILSKRDGSSQSGFIISIDYTVPGNGSVPTMSVSSGPDPSVTCDAHDSIPFQHWTHLAFTFQLSSQTLTIYKNGTPVKTGTLPSPSGMETNDLYIGYDRTHQYNFQGYLDDILIYNRALQTAEILQLYNSTDCWPLGIADLDEGKVHIYPNPAGNKLEVTNLKAGLPLMITDIVGHNILTSISQDGTTQLDISALSPGLYFINNRKFIKE